MTKLTCPWCERSFDLDQLEMADLYGHMRLGGLVVFEDFNPSGAG